jgi:hypothetical protein
MLRPGNEREKESCSSVVERPSCMYHGTLYRIILREEEGE